MDEAVENHLIEVPYGALDPDTLRAVIEAYVLHEGTNYGDREYSLAAKVNQVRRQLDRKQVVLVFNPQSESCNLITDKEFRDTMKGRA